MLYDKRWDAKVETKADPFSLESLIAWLEMQPARRKYEYANCEGECLYGQYLTAHGMAWGGGNYGVFPFQQRIAIAQHRPHTFGAALKRARALTE